MPDAPEYRLAVTKYAISFSCLEEGSISGFMGHTLHGALGYAIRQTYCPDYANTVHTYCQNCTCLYQPLFQPKHEIPQELQSRYRNPPKPYYITTPYAYEKQRVQPGDVLNWNLQVVGDSPPELSKVAAICDTMCNSGLGRINLAWNMDVVISETKTLLPVLDMSKPGTANIQVHFLSPFRPSDEKMKLGGIPFQLLLNSVLERFRIYSLCYGNGSYLPEATLRQLLDGVSDVQIIEQRLRLQGVPRPEKIHEPDRNIYKLNGWVGRVRYNHVPVWAINLLKELESLSIGQHSTFGFGQFKTESFTVEKPMRKRVLRKPNNEQ